MTMEIAGLEIAGLTDTGDESVEPTRAERARAWAASASEAAAALPSRVDATVEAGFARLGERCARRPRTVLATACAVAALSCLGLLRFHLDTDDETLYAPAHSEAVKNQKWVDATFAKEGRLRSRTTYAFATGAKNVLNDRQGLEALFKMHQNMLKADGFADCVQRNNYGFPIVQGPLNAWNYSLATFDADEDWRRTLAAPRSEDLYAPTTVAPDGTVAPWIAPLAAVVGDAKLDDGAVISGRAFQVQIKLHGDCSAERSRALDAALSGRVGDLKIVVHSRTSYRGAVSAALLHDVKLVGASLVFLVLFASVAFGLRGTRRAWLGPAALLSVVLALVTAFGWWIGCGGSFHALMAAAVFMTLGLGVDDAFVIVDAVDDAADAAARRREDLARRSRDDDAYGDDAVSDIIGAGLGRAGAQILLTSVTDAAAFGACALTTSIPALRSFCGVAALCVAVDFVFQVTLFVALLALLSETTAAPPERRSGAEKRFAKALTSRPGRAASLAAAVVLLALGVAGAPRLETEYEAAWLAPDGSDAREAYAVEEAYFSRANSWAVAAYSREGPTAETYAEYESGAAACDGLPFFLSAKAWTADFDAFRGNRTYDGALADWRVARAGTEIVSFAAFDASGAVVATKLPMSWAKTGSKAKQIERLDACESKLEKHRGFGFFVSRSPVLEALALTLPQSLRSVAIVALVVFCCGVCLLGRISAALLLLGVILYVDVVLLGGLYWFGEYCNMITMVVLTLAVGLGVDSSAHVAHAYLHDGSAEAALGRVLSPIAKGGLSTLLAVAPMAFSQSYLIRLFAMMTAMIVALGLFVGVAAVPALLAVADDVSLRRNRRDLANRLADGDYALVGGGFDDEMIG